VPGTLTQTDGILIFARKLLKPFASLSEQEILNEFRAIQKLCIEDSHENVVAVYSYGALPGSLYYYIDMELCNINLQEYIYDFEGRGSANVLAPLDTKGVLQIMRDVSRGLTFIHERKEIHRDIKPNNSNPPCLGLFNEQYCTLPRTRSGRSGTSASRWKGYLGRR